MKEIINMRADIRVMIVHLQTILSTLKDINLDAIEEILEQKIAQLTGFLASDVLKLDIRIKKDEKLPEVTTIQVPEEKYITLTRFVYDTKICTSKHIITMFQDDPIFYECCGKRKGRNFYIKKNAAILYLKKHAEGKIFKKVLKYLKNEEEKCQEYFIATKPFS